MNKGFSYYFRSGIASAKDALKGESFAQRAVLILYFFMSLIGKLCIFTRPIFEIADINLMKMLDECKEFSFEKIFTNIDDKKRYRKLLVFNIVRSLMIFSVLFFTLLPVGLLWGLLPLVLSDALAYTIISGIFSGVFGLLALLFAIYITIIYSPVSFLAASDRNLSVADYFYNSRTGMYKLKRTYFLIALVYSLIYIAIYGTLIGGIVCLCIFLEDIGIIISAFVFAAIIFITILPANYLFVSNKLANYFIFKYSVTDKKTILVKESEDEENTYETVLDENLDEYEDSGDEIDA